MTCQALYVRPYRQAYIDGTLQVMYRHEWAGGGGGSGGGGGGRPPLAPRRASTGGAREGPAPARTSDDSSVTASSVGSNAAEGNTDSNSGASVSGHVAEEAGPLNIASVVGQHN